MPPRDRDHLLASLRRDAAQVSDGELTGLLAQPDWRPRLTAAWMIAADRRETFRDRLGELLLPSQMCFAGQGYCLALARLGTPADAQHLSLYLERYLRRRDLYYDQHWAIGALLHIDKVAGSHLADPFIAPAGLWGQWCTDGDAAASRAHLRVAALCDLLT
ncbi:DUF6000 family protein [Kitasatospora sp. NBC_00240]|uniref:DUF6000 family protein n=1 Tax=Kitasatospora sp. NBC_00240 TaxID=2903567 RepID=UPI00225A8AA7|nr:DUF6000 family protein [Kitasatospora sp. NBC_00240]MCX5216019.1 DUF6000 family protein [Kitasatospora sp. NBC_00240]